MEPIRVYSSQPVGLKLACAFKSIALLGQPVVELPLAQLPPPASPPRRRCTLQDDLVRVTTRLVEIGDQLNDHETYKCRLDAGLEQGLRHERDTLLSRQRAILRTQAVMKGGVAHS
jgi:hypothetical protein